MVAPVVARKVMKARETRAKQIARKIVSVPAGVKKAQAPRNPRRLIPATIIGMKKAK